MAESWDLITNNLAPESLLIVTFGLLVAICQVFKTECSLEMEAILYLLKEVKRTQPPVSFYKGGLIETGKNRPGMIVHAYNPSCVGGSD
jgi:hypothetical protein